MLNPFGGLKKVFSPKNVMKPFKAVHKAVSKPVNSIFNRKKPEAAKAGNSIFNKKPPSSTASAVPKDTTKRLTAGPARMRTKEV